MSQIRSKDTKVEVIFRKRLWSNHYSGYRLKAKLSGKPDLFFSKQKIAVFIDGCFWHKCPHCFVKPKSKIDYWDKKIERNVERDKEITQKLYNDGIEVVRFWEHEVKKNLDDCVKRFQDKYETKQNKNN